MKSGSSKASELQTAATHDHNSLPTSSDADDEPNAKNLLRIHSCWSKAGWGTSIVVEHNEGGAKVVLDLGATPCYSEVTVNSSVVLLTHTHMDHVGAIFAHARAYALARGGGSSGPTYYAPIEAVPLLQQACQAMDALDAIQYQDEANSSRITTRDHAPLKMNFVGVRPNEKIDLPIRKGTNGTKKFIRTFRTTHGTCPSLGYAIGSRLKPSRKKEYQNLSKDEIRDLIRREPGISITEQREVMELVYTGDTTWDVFMNNRTSVKNDLAWLYTSSIPVFICEATMLEDSDKARQTALDRGHMHLDHVMQMLSETELEYHCQEIVLLHISARYSARKAIQFISVKVPTHLVERVSVAITSLTGAADQFGTAMQSNGLIRLSDAIALLDESPVM